MIGETNKLQIKVIKPEIPQIESDQALFALFDFLLVDRLQSVTEKKVETMNN